MPTTYQIVRLTTSPDYSKVTRRVIRRRVTLEEAQEHCRRDDTHGERWFDGYEQEK